MKRAIRVSLQLLVVGMLMLSALSCVFADEIRPMSNRLEGPPIGGIALSLGPATLSCHAGDKVLVNVTLRNLGNKARYFSNMESGGGAYDVIAVDKSTGAKIDHFGYLGGFQVSSTLGGTKLPAKSEYRNEKHLVVNANVPAGLYLVHLRADNIVDTLTHGRPPFTSNVIEVTVL